MESDCLADLLNNQWTKWNCISWMCFICLTSLALRISKSCLKIDLTQWKLLFVSQWWRVRNGIRRIQLSPHQVLLTGSGMYIAERGKKGKKNSVDWQTLRLFVRLMQNSVVCSVKGGELYFFFLLKVDSYIYFFLFFYDKIKENR